MIAVHRMQMTVVQIVDVAVVANGAMTAVGAMRVRVTFVDLMRHPRV